MEHQLATKNSKCESCGKPYREFRIPLGSKKLWLPGCDCAGEAYEKEKEAEHLAELLSKSGIPEKYQDEDMKDWVPVEGTEEAITYLKSYMANLVENVDNGKGMFICGMKGTGKTKIQCYVGNQIIHRLRKRVYYISLARYISDIDELKKKRGNIDSYMGKYINCPVLILDDVGESIIEEWNRKYVFLLLDGRNNRKCVTLANTMKHIQENNKYIGSHNVSRLLEMAAENVVEITSQKDMRFYGNKQSN